MAQPALTATEANTLARRDPKVPYKQLDAACALARATFPHATEVRPQWAPANDDEILVTVFGLDGDRRAGRTFAYTGTNR